MGSLEAFGGLASCSDDEVDADEGVGDGLAYALHFVAEQGGVVVSAHE